MRAFLKFFIKLYLVASDLGKQLKVRYKMRPGNYERAVRKADRLHKKTGKRYRVFYFGKYQVWSRDDIKRRKNAELLKRNMKAGEDFDRIAYYDTDKPGVLFNSKRS